MKKFTVRVGKEFEVKVEIPENRRATILEKSVASLVIFIIFGIVSSATYGAVTGDYFVFQTIMQVLDDSTTAYFDGLKND